MASKATHLHKTTENLDRLVDRLFQIAFEASASAFLKDSLCGWGPLLSSPHKNVWPPVNDRQESGHSPSDILDGVLIQESDNGLIIEIEVSHLNPESIYLEVSDDVLIVRGERNSDNASNQHAGWSIRDGLHLERLIPLPVPVRPGKIRARLVGQIIKINIEKE